MLPDNCRARQTLDEIDNRFKETPGDADRFLWTACGAGRRARRGHGNPELPDDGGSARLVFQSGISGRAPPPPAGQYIPRHSRRGHRRTPRVIQDAYSQALDRPSYFLITTDDRMVPPTAQRAMAKRAGGHSIDVRSSNAVMLSHPAEVATFIESAGNQLLVGRSALPAPGRPSTSAAAAATSRLPIYRIERDLPRHSSPPQTASRSSTRIGGPRRLVRSSSTTAGCSRPTIETRKCSSSWPRATGSSRMIAAGTAGPHRFGMVTRRTTSHGMLTVNADVLNADLLALSRPDQASQPHPKRSAETPVASVGLLTGFQQYIDTLQMWRATQSG